MRISWEQLSQNIESCQACALAAGCLNKVPGQGARLAAFNILA